VGDEYSDTSEELVKLGELLAQPDLRKAFWLDAEGTMKQESVDSSKIPFGLIETLKTLSPLELALIARISTTLRENLTQDELNFIVQFPV
jgi:hypothetical protein